MFKRFILATDLSAASFALSECLGGLRAFGAEQCLLLQCLNLQEASAMAFSYSTAAEETVLRTQQAALERQGFQVETRIVPGFAKTEVNRIAAEEGYDLIVVGAHGQSMLQETLLGGVASAVIHGARRPVLVMRVERDAETQSVRVCPVDCDLAEHILFPTDFSENADHAFAALRTLVASGARRITLLHVQDRTRLDPHLSDRLEEFNAIDQARLERLCELLAQDGQASVTSELRHGNPAEEILAMIRERGAHMVVMGSQGRGFVAEALLGSVSHQIARRAKAAVLLIPALREG